MAKQASTKKAKSRPGPKSKGPFENKRSALTTRITESTRKALEGAADASGRSLSQEIEYRLERSFLFESSLGVMGLESKTIQFIKDVLDCIHTMEQQSGTSIWEMRENTFSLRAAISELLAITEHDMEFSQLLTKDGKQEMIYELDDAGKTAALLVKRTQIEERYSAVAGEDIESYDKYFWDSLHDFVGSLPDSRSAINAGVQKLKEQRALEYKAQENMSQADHEWFEEQYRRTDEERERED